MTTDRELLEAAAKVADIPVHEWYESGASILPIHGWPGTSWWNPLIDDGDALRLAVKMKLKWGNSEIEMAEQLGRNPYAATRRAIVRAAAEVGKSTLSALTNPEPEPTCPECGGEVYLSSGTTGSGLEYSINSCLDCKWQSDPE